MFKIITYITLLFFIIRLFVSLLNKIFNPTLKQAQQTEQPLVSVLIPARNEEQNINNIIDDLKNQSYTNIEVIIFNDQSTDNTQQIIKKQINNDSRFRLINSKTLPANWVGKNYACYQLSQQAHGDYYLFLDADVRISSGLLESLLYHTKKNKLHLLSIFPKQDMQTIGEKITVPIMNFILLSLLPLILIRLTRFPSISAANGQLMLFTKNSYNQLLPHKTLKNKIVEDIAIAKLFKKHKLRIDCLTGDNTIRCRMYKNLRQAISGFSRSINDFFGGHYIFSFLYIFLSTFGIAFSIISMPFLFNLSLLIIILSIIILVSNLSNQSVTDNIIFSIPRQIITGAIIIISLRNKLSKKQLWKGRIIK